MLTTLGTIFAGLGIFLAYKGRLDLGVLMGAFAVGCFIFSWLGGD